MKQLFAILFLLTAISALGYSVVGSPGSATYTITAATQADIQSACTAAVTGDTIYIPSSLGSISITDQIEVVNKGITITGDTVITGAGGASPSASTETILLDDITAGSASSQSVFQLEFYGTTGRLILKKITIQAGARTVDSLRGQLSVYSTGSATTTSSNAEVRINECHFKNCQGRPASFFSWSGLMDHCWVEQNGSSGMAWYGPQTHAGANMSWSRPISEIMGTVGGAFYVEDCTLTQASTPRSVSDGFAGARYVFRHNYIEDGSFENHGTDSGYKRGVRWMECYENTFVASGAPSNPGEYGVLFRSGSGVIYNNSFTGGWPGLIRMVQYRASDDLQPFGLSTGLNAFDDNDPTVYATGTHDGAAAATVLTDSTKSWTSNQWVGYSLINVTQSTGGLAFGGVIASNTSTTITVHPDTLPTYNSNPTWGVGNTYKVLKIITAMDQPGTGQSDLISGTTDSNPGTPVAFPHQVIQPIYYSGNTGETIVSNDIYYHIVSGTHYISGTMPGYTALSYPHPFQGGADTTAPTVTSFAINATGITATITFTEAVTRNSTTPTISLSGGAALLTYSSGSGTSSHVYAIDRIILPGETGTGAATLPANAWEDAAGNDVATFSSYTITNNSIYSTGVPSLPSRRRAGTGAGAALSR